MALKNLRKYLAKASLGLIMGVSGLSLNAQNPKIHGEFEAGIRPFEESFSIKDTYTRFGIQGKNFYQEVEAKLDENIVNNYDKVSLGYFLYNKENPYLQTHLKIGPQISLLENIIYDNPNAIDKINPEKIIVAPLGGFGGRFDYKLNNFSGRTEILLTTNNFKPRIYSRNSLKGKYGEIESGLRFYSVKDNDVSFKIITKPLLKELQLFGEAGVRTAPKNTNNYFNLGIRISAESELKN